MNLELEMIGTIPDRTNKLVSELSRALTAADMKMLETGPSPPVKPPSALKRLSERHKNVARLLSEGHAAWEVAAMTGYSVSAIAHLRIDPAFINLMAFYENAKEIAFVPFHEKLAQVGTMSLDIIQDRLEEEPDKASMGQLLEILKTSADRSGYGPQSTANVNVQVNIADRLQAARKRIEAAKQIEGQAVEIKNEKVA